MPQLSSYPDVYNTCLVLLRRDGFDLSYDKINDMWIAENKGFLFKGDNPIEVLGLTTIYSKLKPEIQKEYWWKIDEPNIIAELDPE